MKSVGVIGQGFVGGSLTTVFAERGFTVFVHDKTGKVVQGGIDILSPLTNVPIVGFTRLQKLAGVKLHREPGEGTPVQNFVRACEECSDFSKVFFVCLPTPMLEDGGADLSIVEGVLNELSTVPGERIAVIKSTVPPGSTERWNKMFEGSGLHIVFNPEFLREASALDDMRNQSGRIVLGGPRPYINEVKQLFQNAFPNIPIIKTSSTTAEMVKYVTNIHLAVKVSLANEFYQICEALDKQGANIDYDKVIEYATIDERLGKSHWQVPGPMPADDTGEPAYGFSGSCMPKDLNALISLAKSLNVKPLVMSAAWTKNLEVRPQRDWEKLVGRAVSVKDEAK
jgi:UDPglucose 6-dehydrogenase